MSQKFIGELVEFYVYMYMNICTYIYEYVDTGMYILQAGYHFKG